MAEHRDDHYIILIITKGQGAMYCDMERIDARAKSILMIKPFQVHAVPEAWSSASGYFLSIAPFLMPAYCHELFQELSIQQQHIPLPKEQQHLVTGTAALLLETFAAQQPQHTTVTKGLFDSLMYRIASLHHCVAAAPVIKPGRTQQLYGNFRKLLNEYSFRKPPSFFAEHLYISTAHLNDCVRSVSGFSVTYWLQDAMLLEARRLLYYTNSTIKEIAYELGFEDHTYFSRLFKKISGETPLSFRNRFRE